MPLNELFYALICYERELAHLHNFELARDVWSESMYTCTYSTDHSPPMTTALVNSSMLYNMSHCFIAVLDLLQNNSLWLVPKVIRSDAWQHDSSFLSRLHHQRQVLYFLKCVNTSLHSCLPYKHQWLIDVVYVFMVS
jgi:hypothetical protein